MAGTIASLPTPAAVVFDLDGTLVDTVERRIAAWVEALDAAGLPTGRDRLAPLIGLDGRRLAREIADLAGRPVDAVRAEAIDRASGEIYERLNQAPRSLPGVSRLISVLEQRGIPWAIATSSRRDQVMTSVAALGVPGDPVLVDASHVRHAKPDPELLLLAAGQLGVDPAACWYVGDSTWDMMAAVAAGMIAIGVTVGSAVDAATLVDAGATTVVGTLTELASALEAPAGPALSTSR